MPTATRSPEQATDPDDHARRLAQEAVQEAMNRRDNGGDKAPPAAQTAARQ